jgi:hypothetical protein
MKHLVKQFCSASCYTFPLRSSLVNTCLQTLSLSMFSHKHTTHKVKRFEYFNPYILYST